MTRTDSRFGTLALLGGTALMLLLLVAIARYPTLFLRGQEYRAMFTSVAGLNPGDEVRYGGLLVGSVTELDISTEDPTRIAVSFRVEDETPVRADTRAAITQVGILGEPYLALEAGSIDAPPLPEGSTLPTDPTMSFQDAVTRLASFFDRADTLFTGMERVVRTSPWDRIDRTLAQMQELVDHATSGTDAVLGELELASRNLNAVLQRTKSVITAVDTAVSAAGPEFAATQREALATLRDMRVLVGELRHAVAAGEGLDETMRDLAITSENLASLTARLERDPASILLRREQPRKRTGPSIRD
ncbi:MAG: MlaD family protein [Gemmatimonadaceae bacterium]